MASQNKAGKRGKGAGAVIEGKKAKIYGGEMWKAVQGWGEGEVAVVIMGYKRRLRIVRNGAGQGDTRGRGGRGGIGTGTGL